MLVYILDFVVNSAQLNAMTLELLTPEPNTPNLCDDLINAMPRPNSEHTNEPPNSRLTVMWMPCMYTRSPHLGPALPVLHLGDRRTWQTCEHQ